MLVLVQVDEKIPKLKKQKKKKNRKSEVKQAEDFCFICGEGGHLIMCDLKNCVKVYHLECLKLASTPRGKQDHTTINYI